MTISMTAKNRDQLRNPTLGDRVWAAFSFYADNHGRDAKSRHTQTHGIHGDRDFLAALYR